MKNIKLTIEGKKILLPFNDHFANLVKINEDLNFGAWDNYKKRGLTYVDVQQIVGITGACENIDTLFKVQSRLSLPLFITQTGQLTLEQALEKFPGVFTVIHSGRDEEKEDIRHLRQFRLTEEEFDCTMSKMTRQTYDEEKMFNALLEHIQSTIKAMLKKILLNSENVLSKIYRRQTDKLYQATKKPFLKINYEKAISLLNKNGYPNLSFGDDLKAQHEAKIVSLMNKNREEIPVFITRYPKEIKFFNMKVSGRDPRVVLSADLILPYGGEGTGSAVREHNFNLLKNRLLASTMYKLHINRGGSYKDFKWYMNIIKQKRTLPHAGYGIGNERILQYIFAESDIRHVSLFSLLDRRTGYWNKEKYGQAGILTQSKKHILLSIGKLENKKFLLPYLQKLTQKNNVVLYATDKTHNFMKQNGVLTSYVYKISEVGKQPNIFDLLERNIFDFIINIPTREKVTNEKEFTDGKLIRKTAVEMGVSLVTDPEVAAFVIKNLTKAESKAAS